MRKQTTLPKSLHRNERPLEWESDNELARPSCTVISGPAVRPLLAVWYFTIFSLSSPFQLFAGEGFTSLCNTLFYCTDSNVCYWCVCTTPYCL